MSHPLRHAVSHAVAIAVICMLNAVAYDMAVVLLKAVSVVVANC